MKRTAVRWDPPEFKISDYKNAKAQTIGRTYPEAQQQALFEALKVAVDKAYIAEIGRKKRTGFVLDTAFSETFSGDLVVSVALVPDQGVSFKRQFVREEVEEGVVEFGAEIGKTVAGLK